jgi:hypothetical protein
MIVVLKGTIRTIYSSKLREEAKGVSYLEAIIRVKLPL